MAEQRVIVIGAGPAGVRAMQAFVQAGVRPIVVDEGRRDGGQIYRRQPAGFTRSYEKLYGTEALKAEALHVCFEQLRQYIDYRPDTLAWNIEPGKLHVIRGAQADVLAYDVLVVCSGATDRLLPVKGWHYAGCYTMGAAQIALKSQACAIGSGVVFMGTGPLMYLVASQYVRAGAHVKAVLDTSSVKQRMQALVQLAARPGMLLNGLALMASLMCSGVKIHTGITPIEITGTPRGGVTGVRVGRRDGGMHEIECDAVGLGFHLRAESQLADLAQCEFRFEEKSRQWLPRIDENGRSSVPGLYLAGDGVRILGADGAELAGRLAALTALGDLGIQVNEHELSRLRKDLRAMDRFRLGILEAFPWPYWLATDLQDDVFVCRCESITVGELRRSVQELGADEVNRAKALCRVGMGRCQGRYCGHAAAEVVASAARLPIQQVGRIRGQGPVKPLPMAASRAESDSA